MKHLDLTQEDLTTPLGVKTRGAVGHYFSGRRQINIDQATALCTALQMSYEELFGAEESRAAEGAASYASPPEKKAAEPTYSLGAVAPWDSSTPLGADELELPLFREVELAGGHGRTQVQENHGAKLRFARSTLARKGIDPSVAACCFVSGDSMARVLPNGSTVAVDTSATHIEDGQMYAIDHGGLLRVKYLHRLPGGRVKVSSENKEYPDEVLEPESLDEFRVVGRVFWYAVLL
uniref:LexA family transcriptional regulator n=1 Tax=Marinobacterium profundum TaxID=1714300 RepID=UPI00082F88AC|nr:S24 family peptidase [Marinobacterium profundum]